MACVQHYISICLAPTKRTMGTFLCCGLKVLNVILDYRHYKLSRLQEEADGRYKTKFIGAMLKMWKDFLTLQCYTQVEGYTL